MPNHQTLCVFLIAAGSGLHALGEGWNPIQNLPPGITHNPVLPTHELSSYYRSAVVVQAIGVTFWMFGLTRLIIDVVNRLLPVRREDPESRSLSS